MKSILVLTLLTSVLACSTAPQSKKVRFEADWIRSALASENYGYKHGERTAPLVEDGTVFQGNGIDGVVAWSKDNGRVKWRFDVRNGVESRFTSDDKSLFFGGSDGNFYSISKLTGKIIWSYPTRTENLGAPALVNGIVYFISGNNILYSLDAKTGKQIWNYNRGDVSSLSIRGAARPTVYKNTVYAGFSDGYLAAININDGSMMWERKLSTNLKFVDVDGSPVIEEDTIWVSSYDGALYALSRSDGQIQWRIDEGGSVPVTIDGDLLIFSSLNHNIYALNKKTGAVQWKYSYEEKYGIPTQAVIHRGLVIFGMSDGSLTALNQQDGKKLAQYNPGSGIMATPIVDKDASSIYVFSNQANLHKLKIEWYQPEMDNLKWAN